MWGPRGIGSSSSVPWVPGIERPQLITAVQSGAEAIRAAMTDRTILHVAQPVEAGVARCVTDLARDQVRRGWRVVVACPPEGPLQSWVAEAGGTHEAWAASRSPGPTLALEVGRLNRILRRVGPDVIHLHSSKAGLAGRLALRGTRPTVFQPHAWSWLAASGMTRAAARRWEGVAARWTDLILCVSEAERLEGQRAGIAARWRVVPNGVDLSRFRPASEEQQSAARNSVGLHGPLVVCVGRLSRQKGQDVLLDGWPQVLQRVPSASLVLVGDGPERHALQRRGAAGVEFVGDGTDVPTWLAAADVVVTPSRWEGMSLVMLEAMAAGRSIVATDVAGVRETLPPGSGAIVPAESPAGLARAVVERLLDSDLRRREETAARAFVEARRDLTRSLEMIAAIYEEVLGNRSR